MIEYERRQRSDNKWTTKCERVVRGKLERDLEDKKIKIGRGALIKIGRVAYLN